MLCVYMCVQFVYIHTHIGRERKDKLETVKDRQTGLDSHI